MGPSSRGEKLLAKRDAMRRVALCSLCAVLALMPSGCGMVLSFFAKPEVEDVQPHFESIDRDGVTVRFDLKVRNPYWFPLRLSLVKCAVEIEGREFATAAAPVNLSLPSRDLGRVSAAVRLSYSNLWNTYQTLRTAQEVDYTLRGAVACSVLGHEFGVPVSKDGRFPVLRLPQIGDVRFRVTEASLRKAVLAIEAAVTNPNAFEVDLQGVGYVFRAGDVELGGLHASTAGAIGPGKTGQVSLTAEIAVAGAALKLIRGGDLGKPSLAPTGTIKTPYGTVRLDRPKQE